MDYQQVVLGSIPIIVTLIFVGAGYLWKEKKAERLRVVRLCTGIAYDLLAKVAPLTETKLDDQAAFALKAFDDAMDAHGYDATEAEKKAAAASLKPAVLMAKAAPLPK